MTSEVDREKDEKHVKTPTEKTSRPGLITLLTGGVILFLCWPFLFLLAILAPNYHQLIYLYWGGCLGLNLAGLLVGLTSAIKKRPRVLAILSALVNCLGFLFGLLVAYWYYTASPVTSAP